MSRDKLLTKAASTVQDDFDKAQAEAHEIQQEALKEGYTSAEVKDLSRHYYLLEQVAAGTKYTKIDGKTEVLFNYAFATEFKNDLAALRTQDRFKK